jgi:hypothetical protein
MPLLHAAALSGSWPTLRLLLRHSPARLAERGPLGLTPLHLLPAAPGAAALLRGLLLACPGAAMLWFAAPARDGLSPAQHALAAGLGGLNAQAAAALQASDPRAAAELLAGAEPGCGAGQDAAGVAVAEQQQQQQQQQQQLVRLAALWRAGAAAAAGLLATLLLGWLARAAQLLQLPWAHLLDDGTCLSLAALAAILAGSWRGGPAGSGHGSKEPEPEQAQEAHELQEQAQLWAASAAARSGGGAGSGAAGAPAGGGGALQGMGGAGGQRGRALQHAGSSQAGRQQQQQRQAPAARDMQLLATAALAALAAGASSCARPLLHAAAAGGPAPADVQAFSWRLVWALLVAMLVVSRCRGRYAATRALALPCLLLVLLLVAAGVAAGVQQLAALAALGWLHLLPPRRRAWPVTWLVLWDLGCAALVAPLPGPAPLLRVAGRALLLGCVHVLLLCLLPARKGQHEA